MLYRRSVNKLMRRAILLSRRHFGSGLISRPVYALKSLILIHPPLSVDIHNSGSRNKPTIVSSRSAAVDDMLRRGLRAWRVRGRKGGGVGNRIACLPRIFPPSCGNSFHGSERRAAKTELCDYIPL